MRTSITFTAIALTVAACGGGGGGSGSVHRNGNAPPVELVPESALADARAGGTGGVHGGAVRDELEPNDGVDTATPLALGGTVRARIGAAEPGGGQAVGDLTDVDNFRIDVTTAGALAVSVSAIDGVDLTLEIVDASGDSLAKSDHGGARTSEAIPNLGVTPGRYTAIVRAKKPPPAPKRAEPKPKKADKKVGVDAGVEPASAPAAIALPVYEITATVAPPPPGMEHEPDDDRGTANDVVAGEPANGYLGWTNDVDVWKLSLEALAAKDVLDIEVSAVAGTAIALDVSDAAGSAMLARKAPRGSALAIRSFAPALGSGAPPFVYLTVHGDRSNPDVPYALAIHPRVLPPDSETEPNDTLAHPFAVPADRTIVHAGLTLGDVDCFGLPTSADAHPVDATVESHADFDATLELVVDGKSVAKSTEAANAAKHVYADVPANATAILRVTGKGSATGDYDLVLHGDDPAP